MKQSGKKRYMSLIICLFLLLTGCTTSEFTVQEVTQQEETAVTETTVDIKGALPGKLEIHYIDVGQGDATLVTCGGQSMLIDAGDNAQGTKLQSYLISQNITKLDYVVGTHPDADHIGGLDVILTKFDCGTIFLTEEEKDTRTYEDVILAMEYKGYQKTLPVAGESYDLGDATFTILAPIETNHDANDNSIVLLLAYQDTTFYFGGDAGEEEENQILASGADVSADVCKVGHHGSKTATSDAMLEKISPQYAVISVGEDNRYGHPHAEVLNKLRAAGIEIFRTDEQGTIVAVSDGNNITFNMSPSESYQAGEPGAVSDRQEEETDMTAVSTQTVHITQSGQKYHRAGCRHLQDSDIEISLEEALAAGYTPCGVCNP